MSINFIRNEDDYTSALKEASTYFDIDPVPGTEEGNRFELLITLIEAWEAKHYPIPKPDRVDAMKFRLEQSGIVVNPQS